MDNSLKALPEFDELLSILAEGFLTLHMDRQSHAPRNQNIDLVVPERDDNIVRKTFKKSALKKGARGNETRNKP